MPSKEKPRNRKLTEFFKQSEKNIDESRAPQKKEESQTHSNVEDDIVKHVLSLLDAHSKQLKTRETSGKKEPSLESQSKELLHGLESDILDKVLEEDIKPIECDNKGVCLDGLKVGEIFTDKYGVKRQRGYVNTTRLPVYLDVIVEEGVVSPLLSKSYSIQTSRNAVAIVPEDFICELQQRYGVILKGFEKCTGEKVSSIFEKKRGRASGQK